MVWEALLALLQGHPMRQPAAYGDPHCVRYPVGRARRRGAMLSGNERRIVAGLGLLLGLLARQRGASPSCGEDCTGDLVCEQLAVSCLRAQGKGRQAIERLKTAVAQYPKRTELSRLLAATYHAEGNTFWAQRTLNRLIEQDPRDCASRA